MKKEEGRAPDYVQERNGPEFQHFLLTHNPQPIYPLQIPDKLLFSSLPSRSPTIPRNRLPLSDQLILASPSLLTSGLFTFHQQFCLLM